MAKSGVLTVRILSDTKQAEAGLRQFESRVQSTGEKLSSAGQKMTMFATVPVAAAMGVATKAASDLNETLSKSNTVFADSAKQVENWADGASDSFGQSKREALDAASTFGNMFVQLGVGTDEAAKMSMAMTELASDFASFHNADITEVIDAQAAAFRGEYDALQRFVPTINAAAVEQEALAQTGKRVTSELTAQEKALAVQKLMLEGAGDAMGDYDRTADSAANQTRRAKAAMEDASAEIGQALLPMVAAAAGGVADLAKGFGELPDPIQTGILAIAGLVAVSGPILTVAGNIGRLNSALRDTEGNLTKTGTAASVFGKAVGALAIAGLAYETIRWAQSLNDARVNIEDIKDTVGQDPEDRLGEYLDFLGNQADAVFGEKPTRNAKDWFRTLAQESPAAAESILAAGQSSEKFRDELERVGVEVSDLQAILDAEVASQIRANQATERSAQILATAEGKTKELGETTDDTKKSTDHLAEAVKKARDKLDEYEPAITDAIDPLGRLEDAIKGVNDALRAQFDSTFAMTDALLDNQEAQRGVEEAERNLKKAQDDLNGAIWLHGEASDEATEASWRLEEAERGLDDANRRAARSAIDVTTAANQLVAEVKAHPEQFAKATAQIDRWAEQGIITEGQARALKDEMNLARLAAHELDQQDVNVQVAADTSRYWAAVHALFSTPIPGVTIGMGDAGGPIILPERHAGGPVHRNKAYLVGRPGAEELFIPGESGQILSGTQTDRARTSGGGWGMEPAILSTLRAIERKLDRTTVSLDGHAVGTMTRREADFHALRNAV